MFITTMYDHCISQSMTSFQNGTRLFHEITGDTSCGKLLSNTLSMVRTRPQEIDGIITVSSNCMCMMCVKHARPGVSYGCSGCYRRRGTVHDVVSCDIGCTTEEETFTTELANM